VERLLKRSDVLELTSMSTSTLYIYMKLQGFPKPVKIGKRSVRWREREVNDWINSLNKVV
jgi:prophage regulatory protein